MNCPYCSTPNRDGANRCRACGRSLTPTPPPVQPQFQQPAPPQPGPVYPPAYPSSAPGIPPLPPQVQANRSPLRGLGRKEVGLGCLLLLVGFVFGIFGVLAAQTVTSSGATPTPSVAEKPQKDFRSPAFKLKTTDDKDTDFPKALEGKAGVLVFWASDAKNDDQMTKLQALAGDRLKVFVVNSKENQSTARKYADSKNWTKVTILLDSQGTVKDKYEVSAIPVYFLINKDGIITDRLDPGAKPEDLEQKINDELLK